MRVLSTIVLVALAGAVGFAFGRVTARPRAIVSAVPDAGPPPGFKAPLEAELALATAREATGQQRYAEALESANRAIEVAPGWADAYSVRAKIHLALAGPSVPAPARLEGSAWAGLSDETSVELRFFPGARFLCVGAICPAEEGRWRLDAGAVRLDYDDADTVEEGTLDGGRLTGKGRARSGGSAWTFDLQPVGGKAPTKEQCGQFARSFERAAADLERSLELDPAAPDRAATIAQIARTRLRATSSCP
jgi:hypothetical protein